MGTLVMVTVPHRVARNNFWFGEEQGFPGFFSRKGIPCPYCEFRHKLSSDELGQFEDFRQAICSECSQPFAFVCRNVIGNVTWYTQAIQANELDAVYEPVNGHEFN